MPNHFELNDNVLDGFITDPGSPEDDSVIVDPTIEAAENKEEPLVPESASPESEETHEEKDEKDFLFTFLSEYGLKDGKVTYENEDGSTEEIDFDKLDSDEKLNILKELTTPNLSKDEIDVINYLRSNHATIQDIITYYQKKAVDDYIKENGPIEKEYLTDDYSDDELYVAELKSKFSDMTEEEIKTDLEIAKENEELFKKKVDIIRKQYKEREEKESKEQKEKQETQFNDFKTSLETQLMEFNEIPMDYKDNKSDCLQIENSEKDEIYNYILNQDENGATQFFKDLNDPKTLVELAWFHLYGKDAISDITNYWKSQLKATRQRIEPKSQTTVVPPDNKTKKDNFIAHRKSVTTGFGENLL